jgi:hypothetical protein
MDIERLLSSGMQRHVALVRIDVSEKHIASIIKVKRTSELATTLAVFLRSVLQFLVTANVPSSLIFLSP